MGQKLYHEDASGIWFSTTRKPGEVRIPNYVYDLWLPLIGAAALGVYSVYVRLERQGAVKKKNTTDIARACRLGKTKLYKINTMLEDCGFIKINQPRGRARLMHWTLEIIILDPPRLVSQENIDKYALPEYETLSPWLVTDKPEPPVVPIGTPGSSSQPSPAVPDSTPNIATLDCLQPLDIEEGPFLLPDPANLTVKEIRTLDLETPAWRELLKLEKAGPSRRGVIKHITAKLNGPPPAVTAYQQISERYPNKALWPGIAETVGTDPENIQFWEKVVKHWIACGWNPMNVKGMLGYYQRREIPDTGKKQNGNSNARSSSASRRPGSAPSQPDGDALPAWLDDTAAAHEAARDP